MLKLTNCYIHIYKQKQNIFKHVAITMHEYYKHTDANLTNFLQTLFILRVRHSVVHCNT
jgi:hypothetical protein